MSIKRTHFLFLLPLLLFVLAGVLPKRHLRVGIYDNPPLSFVDEDGVAQGFVVDILREIAKEENLELEFIYCEWDECLHALDAGGIDLLAPIAFSEERLKRFDFSAETLITNWGQVYVQSDALGTSILNMEGKTIAAVKEDIHTKELQSLLLRFGFSVDFIYVDSYVDVLQKVEREEAFGGIVNHLFAMQYAADYDVVQSSIIYNPIEVRFATTKGEQPETLFAIDQQLISMRADKNSSYYQALNRWFDEPVENNMPTWARWLSVFLAIMLVVLIGGTLFLRKEVRRRTADLGEAEAKYRNLVDNSLVGIYITKNHRIQFANEGLAKLFGYSSAKEILGTHVQKLVSPQTWGVVKKEVELREAGKKKKSNYKFKGICKDGSIIDIEALGMLTEYQGEPAIQGVLIDITERTRAEERFARLSEASLEAIFISEKGICLEANLASEKLFGYSQEEAVGMPATDIFSSEDRDLVIHHILSGYDAPYRVTALRKDGITFPAEVNGRMMRYEGRAVRVTSIRDISAQIKAEENLVESEKRYKNLFENMPIGVYRTTPEGKILDANTAFVKMFGYPDREILTDVNVAKFYANPKDRESALSDLKEKVFIEKREMNIKRYDGRAIWVQDTFRVVRNANNDILYFEGALEDISERVQAEEKLRKSKERFERVIALAPIPMAITLPNGDTEYVNHKFVEVFGYTHKDIVQAEQWWNIIYPDKEYRAFVKKKWEEERAKAEKTGTQIQTQARKVTCKDGTIRNVEFDMMLLGDVEIITMNDITEFTNAQKELKLNIDQLVGQNRISTALATSLDLENLLEIIFKEAALSIQFDAAAVFLKEENGDVTIAKATGKAHVIVGETFSLETTALEHVGLTPFVLDDVEASPLFSQWDRVDTKIRGWMALPLIARGIVLGYLTFDSYKPQAFSPEDVALAESFAPHFAQAIYNARLHKEIQENVQQLEMLNSVTVALSTSLALNDVLELILEKLASVIPYDSATIFLFEKGQLLGVAEKGLPEPEQVIGHIFPSDDLLLQKVLKTQEPLLIDDIKKDASYQGWGGTIQTESWLGVPLIIREKIIGILTIDNKLANNYRSENIELVLPFASQAAQAIYNARLHEKIQKNLQQLETLSIVTSVLSTSLELDKVLELIFAQIEQVVSIDSGAILLLRENELHVVVDLNIVPSTVGQVFPIKNALLQEIIREHKPVIVSNIKEDTRFENWGQSEKIESWMGVPLLVRDELIGFLTLDNNQSNAYSEKEIELLHPFAAQAAQAIANAHLYERVIADTNELEKRVQERTEELQKIVNLTANREIRMAELKRVIVKLRTQLIEVDQVPIADDPLRHPKKQSLNPKI